MEKKKEQGRRKPSGLNPTQNLAMFFARDLAKVSTREVIRPEFFSVKSNSLCKV